MPPPTRGKHDLESAEAANPGTDPKLTANLKELRREFDRATKLTVELVARDSVASSLAKHAWADARDRSDFSQPSRRISKHSVGIAREKAELWGYADEPYDALLDGYERATSTAAVARMFDEMRPAAAGNRRAGRGEIHLDKSTPAGRSLSGRSPAAVQRAGRRSRSVSISKPAGSTPPRIRSAPRSVRATCG